MGSKSEYEPQRDRKINRNDVEDSTNERKSLEFHEKVNQKSAKENEENFRRSVILKTPDKEDRKMLSNHADTLKECNGYLLEQNRTPESNERKKRRERNPLPKNETLCTPSYDHNKSISKQTSFNDDDLTESPLTKSPDDRKRFPIGKLHKSLDGERSRRTDSDEVSNKFETQKTEFELDGRPSREARTQDTHKYPDIISRSHSLKTPQNEHTERSVKTLKSDDRHEIPQSPTMKSPQKAAFENDVKSSISSPKSQTFNETESDKRNHKKLLYEFGRSVDVDDGDIPHNSTKSQSLDKEESEKRSLKGRKFFNNLTESRALKSPELFENKDKKKRNESENLYRDDTILETRSSKILSDGSHTKSPAFKERLNQRTKSSESIPDALISPDVEKSGDNVERTGGKASKSPVYLEELNNLLSERQHGRKSSISNKNVVVENKEDSGVDIAFVAHLEGLHGRKDNRMSTPKYSEKDMEKEKKEKRERRRKGDHIVDSKLINMNNYGGKTTDKSIDSDNEKEKSIKNKMKGRTLEDKEPRMKKGFMRKKHNSSSCDSELRTDSGSEDETCKKKEIMDTTPNFSELMANKKKTLQLINEKSKEKDGIMLPQESKERKEPKERSSHRKKSMEVDDELQSVSGISEIVDDIFEENNSPKKKTLQRQIHLKSGNEAVENEAEKIRSKGSFYEKKDGKEKRVFKDEVDTSLSKLTGALSCDDITTHLPKERTSSNLSKGKSLSATNISNFSSSPKKDKSLNKSISHSKITPLRNDATFTIPSNSADMKEIIYHQWLEKKKVQTKEEIKAKMLARKKAAQQAEAEANDRKVTAKKIYDAWNDIKTGQILTEKETRQHAKQAEKEKMEECLQRKKDAEKYFEAWKQEKDNRIKKLHSQKKKEEKQKDKETFEIKRQTSEEALKAFETWKTQKAKELAEMKKREEEEKAKHGEEKLLAFEKKQEALRVYEEWKSNAKKSPRGRSPQLTQSGRTHGTMIDAKLTKPNINSDAKLRKPNINSDAKLRKLMINSDATLRKPNMNSNGKYRKENVSYKSEKTSIEKESVNSSYSIITWSLFIYSLWRIVACIAILYYAEKLMEEIIFKGVGPCLKMVVKWLSGFAESVEFVRNKTLNKRQGFLTCFH